ncbi:MAG: substrate-binding domain-containing protein [Oscillospiraceae bacterium]
MNRVLAIMICISILIGCSACMYKLPATEPITEPQNESEKVPKKLKIGISVLAEDKSLLPNMISLLQQQAEHYPDLDLYIASTTQSTAEQITYLLQQDVQLIAVEIGNDEDAIITSELIAESDLPIIFMGKRPPLSVMQSCKTAYYSGVNESFAGQAQGELAVRLWDCFSIFDRNKDGKMQLLLITDTENIPIAAMETIENIGVDLELFEMFEAGKTAEETQKKLSEQIVNYKKMPEMILCADDTAAIGAVVALQNAGYNNGVNDVEKTVGVIGFGGNNTALKIIRSNAMTATLSQDTEELADKILQISRSSLIKDEVLSGDNAANIEIDYKRIIAPKFSGE